MAQKAVTFPKGPDWYALLTKDDVILNLLTEMKTGELRQSVKN